MEMPVTVKSSLNGTLFAIAATSTPETAAVRRRSSSKKARLLARL
jgi:hypothetical protein